jgi:aspartate/glutamate racemase
VFTGVQALSAASAIVLQKTVKRWFHRDLLKVGTRILRDWLKEHYGIESIMPASEESQRELHRIIQQELQLGVFKPASRKYVLQQIEELRKRGAEGIVLACTEFPLIIRPEDVSVPVFDTTLLHSQMAVNFILGKPGIAKVRRPR